LLLPTLVVTEVAYFIGSRLGAEAETRFVGDIAAGLLVVHPVAASDWLRIAELVWTYRQMSLGTVDASTITLAERLRERQIATLDRRHFGVVRPAHVQRFELVPLRPKPDLSLMAIDAGGNKAGAKRRRLSVVVRQK
jgi:predicted nucleic acid-binding protein